MNIVLVIIVVNRIATSRRVPLRDAIERRPAPDDTIEDFDEPIEDDLNQIDQVEEVIPQTPLYQVVQPLPGYPTGFGFPFFQQTPQNYYIETRRTLYSPLQYFAGLVNGRRSSKSIFIPNTPFFNAYAGLAGCSGWVLRRKPFFDCPFFCRTNQT